MKTILKSFLAIILTALVAVSCKIEKDQEEGKMASYWFLVSYYGNPCSLDYGPAYGSTFRSTTKAYFNLNIGVNFDYLQGLDFHEYMDTTRIYAEKYNDINFLGNPIMNQPTSFITDICKVSFKALNDFNDNYPSGSSLDNITEVLYATVKPSIDNDYLNDAIILSEPKELAKQVSPCFANGYTSYFRKKAADVDLVELMAIVDKWGVFTVNFTEEPSVGEKQVEATVVFQDGTTLTTTAKFALMTDGKVALL